MLQRKELGMFLVLSLYLYTRSLLFIHFGGVPDALTEDPMAHYVGEDD
jgi:hypothetical protein